MSSRPIHVSRLVPHPSNVRDDLGDLAELAASIAAQGILQPLVAEPRADSKYTVLAGHRRLAAAKRARLEMVPVIIQPARDAGKAIEVMLVENCQRRDLSAVEKARAMGSLRDDLGYSAAAIAKATGLSQSTVSYYLSLLDLDEESLAKVASGEVRVGHAVAAVRTARKAKRGRATGRPVQVNAAWFTGRHPLARAARALCDHRTRPLVGDVACGQCWEQAIRDDAARPAGEPEPLERFTRRQERMQVIASLPMLGGPTPDGVHVTAREAAERLGVSERTVTRYKRDLATAERAS
jgi:ParB family chromosome partitioning protein